MKTQIHHFVMFAFNYPHDFIEKAWADTNDVHFLSHKFQQCYDSSGPRGAMCKFWAELDDTNREKLANFIETQYKP